MCFIIKTPNQNEVIKTSKDIEGLMLQRLRKSFPVESRLRVETSHQDLALCPRPMVWVLLVERPTVVKRSGVTGTEDHKIQQRDR